MGCSALPLTSRSRQLLFYTLWAFSGRYNVKIQATVWENFVVLNEYGVQNIRAKFWAVQP